MRQPSLRKAAVLVASLDQQTADLLLEQMGPEQADHVRRAILHLGDVDPEEQRDVIDDFFRVGPLLPEQHPAGIELDGEVARQLAIPGSDNRRAGYEPFASERAVATPAFRFLQETELEHLATFLRREHPQTIAVVASHLPPDRAGELLAHLPSPIQVQVIRRLADLEQADPRVLLEVEHGLQQWLAEQVQTRRRRTDGVAAVSAILDSSPPDTRRDIMDNLRRHDRPLAGKFRTNQCTFADWTRQNDAALVAVFEAADPEMRMLRAGGRHRRVRRPADTAHSSAASAHVEAGARAFGPDTAGGY